MSARPEQENLDKAGHEYWDHAWDVSNVPAVFDPHDTKLENTFFARVHEYFEALFRGRKDLKILEIGCAHSVWPHYFQKYHGAQVDGIDYSEIGCQKTRQMWEAQGLTGKIYCADLFKPSEEILGQYDLVVSFGVVEHFKNTASCLKACSAFLKPEGRLFTMIPNMSGLLGFLQKTVDREVYDIHVPLSVADMKKAHKKAGLRPQKSDYFMSLNLSVVNSGRFSGRPIDRILRRLFSVPTKLIWLFERHIFRLPVSRFLSPYIFVLADRHK